MSVQDLADLQNRIVVSAVSGLEKDWDVAVVNMEIEEENGGITRNSIAFYLKKVAGVWKQHEFFIPRECSKLFPELRELSANEGIGDKWSICTLEVTSEGRYEFAYSYESPPRINGIHNDESMLNNFVPTLVK